MSGKVQIIVIIIIFIAGGISGFFMKASFTEKQQILVPDTKTEVVIEKVPVNIYRTKFIEREKVLRDTVLVKSDFSLTDSISGKKDSVEYSIAHSIESRRDSVESRWNISLYSLLKEKITEKNNVILKEVEVSKPFYSDGWFWASFIAIPLLLLAIIF